MSERKVRLAGWKETVALPELGLRRVTAKLDTGARTAALHAADILVYETAQGPRIAFTVHPHASLKGAGIRCTAPLIDRREVTNSGGATQVRYVISTEIQLAGESFRAEVTLSDRTRMRYPMLLGRTSLAGRFRVDPAACYRLSRN